MYVYTKSRDTQNMEPNTKYKNRHTKPTTIRITQETRKYCAETGITLTNLMNNAPRNEEALRDMRTGIKAKDEKIMEQDTEIRMLRKDNFELQRFKINHLDNLKKEAQKK